MALDFEKAFSDFALKGDGSSVVSEVYDILPSLTPIQMSLLHQLVFFADKYELPELIAFVEAYKRDVKANKNLGVIQSMNVKTLLRAYSLEEYFKGMSVNKINKEDK